MENLGWSPHKSYVWSCLTLNEDCPFFSSTNPTLFYFGLGLLGLYAAYLLIVVLELKFHWPIDEMQQQVDYNIHLISQKVKLVQSDQDRLMNMQERTERQLMKSRQGIKMLEAVRGAVARDDMRLVCDLVKRAEQIAHDEHSRNFAIIRDKDIYSEQNRKPNNS